jgi:hypothetical protein
VTSAFYNLVAACPDAIDGIRARRKDEAVENGIAAASGQ